MTSPVPGNTSQTARLMVRPPGFAVGWQERIILPAPAAGQQWSYRVDGRYTERLVAVTFALTTSAVVANRFPVLLLRDNNGTVITEVPAGNAVAAASTVTAFLVNGSPGLAQGAVGDTYGFLPDLLIPGDWTWGSGVGAMDPGDQLSGAKLLVHRFPNDAAVISAG